MIRIIFAFIIIIATSGCETSNILEDNYLEKKYVVVSTFNETMLETTDKAEAYEAAHNLTLFGRVFSSKPCYFVLEKGVEK